MGQIITQIASMSLALILRLQSLPQFPEEHAIQNSSRAFLGVGLIFLWLPLVILALLAFIFLPRVFAHKEDNKKS